MHPADLKDRACVVSVGSTPQGKLPGYSGDDLAIWAFRLALEDAGLHKDDIDGLLVAPSYAGEGKIEPIGRRLGLEPSVSLNVYPCGRLVQTAAMLVALGMCHCVACLYGTNQRSNRNPFGFASYQLGGNIEEVYGFFSPGAVAALNYRRRMADFGATEEQLGAVAVAQSKGAALNPLAFVREVLTIEEYLNSPYIIEPLRRPDFSLITDGGFAFIIASPERARDLRKPPVYIHAFGNGDSFLELEHPRAAFHPSQDRTACAVWDMSALSPKDMDALYVQDGFSPNVLIALENYGFCEFGTAHEWVQGGRIELGGELPVNVNGGQSRETYMVGWNHTADAVRQLRGECGPRQVPNARLILCTYSAGGWQQTQAIIYRSDR